MNWIKKWYYLILFVSTGIVYLVYVSDWQVYAKVAAVVRGGYDIRASGYRDTEDGDGGGKNDLSGNGAGGAWNDPTVSGGDGAWEDPTVSGGDGARESQPGDGDADWVPEDEGSGQPNDEDTGWEPEDGADGWESEGGDDAWQDEPAEKGVSYMAVEDDYFADAVFIGDSRSGGHCHILCVDGTVCPQAVHREDRAGAGTEEKDNRGGSAAGKYLFQNLFYDRDQ